MDLAGIDQNQYSPLNKIKHFYAKKNLVETYMFTIDAFYSWQYEKKKFNIC